MPTVKCKLKFKVCPVCGCLFQSRWPGPSGWTCEHVTCRNCDDRYLLRLRRQREIEQEFGEPIDTLLRRLYCDEQMGIKKIARHIGVSDRNLWEWFESLDIERRPRAEAVKLQWVDNPERRELSRQLASEHLVPIPNWTEDKTSETYQEICQKISHAKLKDNWMRGRTASLHHLWKGGKVWWRGKEWDTLKLKIRKRDGFHCQHCGMTEDSHLELYGQPLQVHHKIPYRMTQDNSDNNLITLCSSCHTKADMALELPLLEPTLWELGSTSNDILDEQESKPHQ